MSNIAKDWCCRKRFGSIHGWQTHHDAITAVLHHALPGSGHNGALPASVCLSCPSIAGMLCMPCRHVLFKLKKSAATRKQKHHVLEAFFESGIGHVQWSVADRLANAGQAEPAKPIKNRMRQSVGCIKIGQHTQPMLGSCRRCKRVRPAY